MSAVWSVDSIPLDEMTLNDKLTLIERVWDSLSQTGNEFASPDWHSEELQYRQEKVQNGETEFVPLTTVRARLKHLNDQ